MNINTPRFVPSLLLLLTAAFSGGTALAQPFEIDWYRIDSGGISNTTAAGGYVLGSSISQAVAISETPPAGGYIIAAGFWTVQGSCPADLNADGFADDTDFVIFAAAYDLFTDPRGDFNRDGFTDDTDFVIFAAAYSAFACS